jgi:RNA polymerase sigma-70 factor (ECF subfamily)
MELAMRSFVRVATVPCAVTAAELAIADAFREHEALLTAIARRLCANRADAADLVQDTYERALRGWDHYADRGTLRSWLVTILNNLFVDRCRKARRAPRSESIETIEIAAAEPPPPPPWAAVTGADIQAALATIGPEFRGVYELFAAGRSYEEIAAELQIPKSTVGTRLIRARRRLKAALMPEIGGEP